MREASKPQMSRDLFWLMGQLELLGELRIGLMHCPSRTPEKFMYVSVEGVEIGGDGILRSVAAHGASLEGCTAELFARLSDLAPGQYVVIDSYKDSRRAVEWHEGLGSWVPVKEALCA